MTSVRNIFEAYAQYVHYNVDMNNEELRMHMMSIMAQRYVFNSLQHITSPHYGGIEFTGQKLRQIVNVITNPGLSPLTVNVFAIHYSKYKRIYNAFVYLARLWKIKKYPVQVSSDLFLAPLSANDPGTYILLQNKCQYYFTLRDLSRTVVESIIHSQGLFSVPLTIKNPYTNIPFSKTELFNIYLTMKERGFPRPLYFWKFFRCEFNIFEFRKKTEHELRNIAIGDYINTAPHTEIYPDLGDMLFHHGMHNTIRPDRDFSVRQWVDDMRPFLRLFFTELYSFNINERTNAHNELQYKLQIFAMRNPNYGKSVKHMNTIAMPLSITNYLQNHIYSDLEYNAYINPRYSGVTDEKLYEFSASDEGDNEGGHNEGGHNEAEDGEQGDEDGNGSDNESDITDDYEDGRWESPL